MITVKIAPVVPSPDLEPKLHAAIVAASSDILGKQKEVTAVTIERVDPRSWYVGGATLAAQRKSGFWLDIRITEGTNTKDEKARFVAEIFAAMQRLLGELHEESYVHVNEVKGDAYGFGGLTQERRYIAKVLAQETRHAAREDESSCPVGAFAVP
jgi:4-oxalocrotonate tautomerase